MGHQEMGGLSFSLFFKRCPPQVRAVIGMGIVIRVPAHYCRPAVGPKPKVQCEWGGAFLSKSTNPFGRLSTLPTTFCTHCEGPPTMPTIFSGEWGENTHPGSKLCSLPTVQTPLKYAAINGLFPFPLLATHLVVMFLPLFSPFPVVTTRGGRKRRKLRHEQTDDGPNGDSSSSDSPAALVVVTRFRERKCCRQRFATYLG